MSTGHIIAEVCQFIMLIILFIKVLDLNQTLGYFTQILLTENGIETLKKIADQAFQNTWNSHKSDIKENIKEKEDKDEK